MSHYKEKALTLYIRASWGLSSVFWRGLWLLTGPLYGTGLVSSLGHHQTFKVLLQQLCTFGAEVEVEDFVVDDAALLGAGVPFANVRSLADQADEVVHIIGHG